MQGHVQNRTHRLYRVCLVKSERMSNEQKTPGGTGVREMERSKEKETVIREKRKKEDSGGATDRETG